MTLLEEAKQGHLTEEIKLISKKERITEERLRKLISKGHVVIMKRDGVEPLGIGSGLRTKINVNLGTSSSDIQLDKELEKIEIVQYYGGDTISDLSMGGNIDEIRNLIIQHSHLPITTVPIYQTIAENKDTSNISEDQIFNTIAKQIKDGVSSIVIHAGFSLEDLDEIKGKRIMGLVSKGGTLTARVMKEVHGENPFLKQFEYILEMMSEQEVVLNLGNAMRSGCIHDPIDEFHVNEIRRNAKLANLANEKGIQVIVESFGGHITLNELIPWIKKQKQMTQNRPLFVSGPLPVEIGVGHDHISAAIGGAIASGFGADYLCAITPAEHLKLPSPEDIKQGLIACKIAAHSGDSMKFGLNHLFNDDLELARHRYLKDWEKQSNYCIDRDKFIVDHPPDQKNCSMCGKHCALDFSRRVFKS